MNPHPLVKGGPGRPKGSLNRLNRSAKDAIAQVFEELGGVEALKAWVLESEEHKKLFYSRIYPKLLPYHSAKSGGAIVQALAIRFV